MAARPGDGPVACGTVKERQQGPRDNAYTGRQTDNEEVP